MLQKKIPVEFHRKNIEITCTMKCICGHDRISHWPSKAFEGYMVCNQWECRYPQHHKFEETFESFADTCRKRQELVNEYEID